MTRPPGFNLPSRRAFTAALPLAAAACATPQRIPAVPASATARAEAAVPDVRFLPERDPDHLAELAARSFERERAWRERSGQTGPLPPVDYLVISGGGGDGAYGA